MGRCLRAANREEVRFHDYDDIEVDMTRRCLHTPDMFTWDMNGNFIAVSRSTRSAGGGWNVDRCGSRLVQDVDSEVPMTCGANYRLPFQSVLSSFARSLLARILQKAADEVGTRPKERRRAI